MKTWFKISSAKKATIVCYHRPILAYTLSLQCIELSVAIPKTMNGHLSLVLNVFNETQKNVIAYLTISQHIDGTDSRNPWASYQIRKIAGCACAGNVGIVFPHPRFQRKPLVSDPDMHHGTCVTHVPWCMSGSLTCGDGENVPDIPGACAPAILRIWQEAHVDD